MPKLIKDNAVIDDSWTIVSKTESVIPAGTNQLLPYRLWVTHAKDLENRTDIGVWFDSDEMPVTEHAAALQKLPLIAINFPVFTDGRGFSIARLMRERIAYAGELRAFGYVIRDQLCFMRRCGFTSFMLQENADLTAALASLHDFTDYYQTSVDQPLPLFRRNA